MPESKLSLLNSLIVTPVLNPKLDRFGGVYVNTPVVSSYDKLAVPEAVVVTENAVVGFVQVMPLTPSVVKT